MEPAERLRFAPPTGLQSPLSLLEPSAGTGRAANCGAGEGSGDTCDEELASADGLPSRLPPSILARALSFCSARCLARIEVALGRCLGVALSADASQWLNWASLLSSEGGLHLFRSCSDRREGEAVSPSASTKAMLRMLRCSTPLGRGCRIPHMGEGNAFAAHVARLSAELADGRPVSTVHFEGGTARRLALRHFDVRGCFAGTSWRAAVDGFLRAEHGAPAQVQSGVVRVSIGETVIPLALTLEAWDKGRNRDVVNGISLGFDINEIDLPAPPGADLRIECLLSCGPSVRRRASYTLESFDDSGSRSLHGAYRLKVSQHFWSFHPDGNCGERGCYGHVASLEVLVAGGAAAGDAAASAGAEHADTFSALAAAVGTAEWNVDLSGVGLAPLAYDLANACADGPFEPGSMVGRIALVWRGGQSGFAQKTLAAQAAGAVGCIVCRRDDTEVACMSRVFESIQHPKPDIPSIIVDAATSERLMAAARCGADARIVLDRSPGTMRKLSPEFEAFANSAARGEPIHLAVLVEEHVPPHFTPRAD
mmetsp:Transcript_85810/g.246277  ORF Transcript_85810/g.246277 Transcript_85810/m.246277 type:complete len:539 (+) Transcript_85810:100-1716(+)